MPSIKDIVTFLWRRIESSEKDWGSESTGRSRSAHLLPESYSFMSWVSSVPCDWHVVVAAGEASVANMVATSTIVVHRWINIHVFVFVHGYILKFPWRSYYECWDCFFARHWQSFVSSWHSLYSALHRPITVYLHKDYVWSPGQPRPAHKHRELPLDRLPEVERCMFVIDCSELPLRLV